MPYCQSTGRTPHPFSSAGLTRVDVPGRPKLSELSVSAPQVSPPGTVCAAAHEDVLRDQRLLALAQMLGQDADRVQARVAEAADLSQEHLGLGFADLGDSQISVGVANDLGERSHC